MSIPGKYLLLLLSLFSTTNVVAANIKGHVFEKGSKEQLIGAMVVIKDKNMAEITQLDGSYNLASLEPGEYNLIVSYLGFTTVDTLVNIGNANQVLKIDFYLSPAAKIINQVVVTGKAYGGSDEYANRSEQKSLSLMNIMSANAMQISPDLSVANVMQRVSGVNMDKGNSGEARYAVIRGMDKRYNSTLVNGVKIPSPNDKDRYVPLDIFPAELLERLEVIKTLMPAMEGDATGGVVNMVMKNAPAKLMVEANLGAGYSDIFQSRDFLKFDGSGVNKKSPAEITGPDINAVPTDFSSKNLITSRLSVPVNSVGSLTLGNRFLKNKLGVILAGSYQNSNRGPNSNVLVQNATVANSQSPTDPLVRTFSDILVRQYSTTIKRSGVEGKLDYSINDNNNISLFAFYAGLDEYRVRSTSDSLLGGYSFNNHVGIYKITDQLQTRLTLSSISSITLQGKHKIFRDLNADWSLVASEAGRHTPDIAIYEAFRGVKPDTLSKTYVFTPKYVDDETRVWTHNTDKDLAGYANFHYNSSLIPGLTKIDFGGLIRHKNRDNFYNKYTLKYQPDLGSGEQLFHSIAESKFFFSPNSGLGNWYENGGTYTFTEDIMAYYLQLHYEPIEKIKIDGGLRVENTDQSYMSSLPSVLQGKSGAFSYADFLPSIQGKYELNSKSALRLSYYRSIYRPAYADLVPFIDPNADEIYPSQGNPDVRHTVVDNFDLRYELFPKGLDQFLFGVFYKGITDPIEYVGLQQGFSSGIALTPGNFGDAKNVGLELVLRKYIGKFGVSFNYTYTYSEIVSAKRLYWANAASGTHYDTVYPKRPLQGQAPHIGNLSFLYKDTKHNIEAQLAFVYIGERLYTLAPYNGLDNWEKPTFGLDFSAQKRFGKHFTVYLKANNLLNTGFQLFIKAHNNTYTGQFRLPFQESADYVTVQKDTYYRSFLLGVRYKI